MLALDMQLEIIKRLPVKSLIQFRSVCKAWKSFIDSSQFIAGYSHTQPQHLMIRYEVGEEPSEVKYVSYVDDDDDDDDDDDSFPQQKFSLTVPPLVQLTREVIDSSHGLLCLIGYVPDPNDSDPTSKTRIAVLWNPAIRKSVAVDVPDVVVHQTLTFISVVGFGVCPHTKDPKLVKIRYIYDTRKIESISCSIPCQVMVFTLSSREWTCLSTNHQLPRKSIKFTGSDQTVIGQFIYWLACDWIVCDRGYEIRNLIMSFDLSTQEFREVQLPDSLVNVTKSDLFVSRLRESLVLLQYNDVTDKQVCDVWMMEHGAFTKLFTINPPNASVSWTLGFRKSGEPIVEIRDDHKDFKTPSPLVVYEPCSQHIRDLGIRGKRYSFYGSFYVESLLLLDHHDGHIVRYGAVNR